MEVREVFRESIILNFSLSLLETHESFHELAVLFSESMRCGQFTVYVSGPKHSRFCLRLDTVLPGGFLLIGRTCTICV